MIIAPERIEFPLNVHSSNLMVITFAYYLCTSDRNYVCSTCIFQIFAHKNLLTKVYEDFVKIIN